MRWNEYLYRSQREANRRERMRLARRARRDASSGDLVHERLLKNPTADDIADGSALNAVLEQLSDPSVHSSSIRQATVKLPGKLVRAVPFRHASEPVSISLDQLTAEEGWPIALRGEAFSAERKAYSAAIDKALEEDHEGDISPEALGAVRESLAGLRAKLKANPPIEKAENAEAERYIRTLVGMTRMLERPEIDKIVGELDQVKETTLGNLLGFMQSFNLRFGPATTPEQRAAYETLHPAVVALRDQVITPTEKSSNSTTAKKGTLRNDRAAAPPVDFFSGMKLHELEGKPAPRLEDRRDDQRNEKDDRKSDKDERKSDKDDRKGDK